MKTFFTAGGSSELFIYSMQHVGSRGSVWTEAVAGHALMPKERRVLWCIVSEKKQVCEREIRRQTQNRDNPLKHIGKLYIAHTCRVQTWSLFCVSTVMTHSELQGWRRELRNHLMKGLHRSWWACIFQQQWPWSNSPHYNMLHNPNFQAMLIFTGAHNNDCEVFQHVHLSCRCISLIEVLR